MTAAIAMLATGVAGGVLAGLFGVGGGIVIVPVLDYVLGLLGVDLAVRMHVAVATSLATIIPTAIASARAVAAATRVRVRNLCRSGRSAHALQHLDKL